ncbi:MAG TPA: ABC transporter substrate-binding protein [Chloroflexota bacterium]|nr:ABC transporter substrate-binding protein [Chloroflexota bacterium]
MVGTAPVSARMAAPALLRGRRTYRIPWVGGTCEASTYTAYAKHLWSHEGIDVEIIRLGAPAVTDALATGKVDAAGGILYNWLKPIEQGVDVHLAAGLHGGCLRMVVGAHTGIKTFMDLKGKSIGTDGIGASAMNFFSVALIKAGINPTTDVSWRVYPPAQYGAALDKGEIQAVAALDPFPYLLTQSGQAVEIGSNMTGMFANNFCCVVALRGALVREDPKAAAALTRGWMNGSRYTGTHIHEVATIEVQDKFVPIGVSTVEHLLGTYTWHPSASTLKPQILQGARDFKLTGFLDQRTDPQKLAERAYVDIFKLAGEAP